MTGVDMDALARAVTEKVTRKMAHELVRLLDAEIKLALHREVAKYIDERVMPEVTAAMETQHASLVLAGIEGVKKAVTDQVALRIGTRIRGYSADDGFDKILATLAQPARR